MTDAPKTDDNNDTVFMRNLSYDSNEESLKAFVEENFGKTKYCLICRNKETGDSRGTAFAKFENAEDAAKCLEEFKDFEMQHKFHFDGRNIIVLPVIPRDKVHEVKQTREKEVIKEERHKRRERLIKERVLAKQKLKQEQKQRRINSSNKTPPNKTKPGKRKKNKDKKDKNKNKKKKNKAK